MPAEVPSYLEDTPRLARKGQFVILFGGRTGSSFIVSALNSHPAIVCYPEVLARADGDQQRRIINGIRLGLPIEQTYPFAARADFFPATPLADKALPEVSGFKAKVRDIKHPAAFKKYLREHGYKVIRLVRRNVLKTAISKINVLELREIHNRANLTEPGITTPKTHISFMKLSRHIALRESFIEREQQFMGSIGVETHEFAYEDLLADKDAFFNSMLACLGVEVRPLVGSFVKTTPDDLRLSIENFDELRDAFAGTPYYDQFTS